VIRGLHHIQLAMPAGGERDAVDFYQGILGVPEVAKPPDLAPRGGCWFEDDRVRVHLGVDPTFVPARKAHPAFLVEDLGGLVRRLERAGAVVVRDQPLTGYDRVYVDDPFGNRIELMQAVEA
jgi:catechol 2,3-dioxygenase-like lactoylglutathione lyase family enzyme